MLPTVVWHALHACSTQQTPGTRSGERGEVVVVALAAALDLAVARERGGGGAGRKRARVLLARVGWGQPDGIENEILFRW
jgi:hypothetical protein